MFSSIHPTQVKAAKQLLSALAILQAALSWLASSANEESEMMLLASETHDIP